MKIQKTDEEYGADERLYKIEVRLIPGNKEESELINLLAQFAGKGIHHFTVMGGQLNGPISLAFFRKERTV